MYADDDRGPAFAPAAPRPGLPVDPRRVFRAIRRRARILAVLAVLGVVAGVVVAKTRVPRQFQAAAVLAWSPAPGEPPPDASEAERRLRGAVERVKLPTVLARVREELQLAVGLDALGARIHVTSGSGSDLMTIVARDADPNTAARLADATATSFLAERLREQREAAAAQARSLDAELTRVRDALAASRADYEVFRNANGIADLPVERALAIEQSASLRTESERARVDAMAESSRASQLALAVEALPAVTVLSQNESRPDVRRLAEVENLLAAARATLAPDHPRVLSLESEAAALRARAEDPSLTISDERIMGRNPVREFLAQGNADAESRHLAAEQRSRTLGELADRAAGRVRELTGVEGEASDRLTRLRLLESLIAELDRARAVADDAAHREVADLRLLSPATVPNQPLPSKRKLVAIALPTIVMVLALVVIIGGVLRGLRLHTPIECAYWTRAPVAASSTWPREPDALAALVADLAAPLRRATGTTLVVPAGAAEHGDVRRLAAQLSRGETSSRVGTSRLGDVQVWDGEPRGQELRRAVRRSDRVLVVVRAGAHAIPSFATMATRVGRSNGIALVVIDLGTDLAEVIDQVGDVGRFWRTIRHEPRRDASEETT